MAANDKGGIADEVLNQLLQVRDPAKVFETGGLVDEPKKRLAERMLNGEMKHHLDTAVKEEAANHCNAYGAKTVVTDTGKLELTIPPRSSWALIGKYRRRCRLRRRNHRALCARHDDPGDRGFNNRAVLPGVWAALGFPCGPSFRSQQTGGS